MGRVGLYSGEIPKEHAAFCFVEKTAAQRPQKNQGRPGRGAKRRKLGSGVNRGVSGASGARIITKNTTAQRPGKKWSAKSHEKNPVLMRLGKNWVAKHREPA